MTDKEAIEIIKTAIVEVEWEYPMDYAVAFDMAIEALENQSRLSEHIRIIDEEKLLHHMWEALWKCEDETEEQEGFDAFNRFYIQKGFEVGLQAVIQEPIAYDIEIEKQIPKKPTRNTDKINRSWTESTALCPICNEYVGNYDVGIVDEYCRHCGQAILWEEEE